MIAPFPLHGKEIESRLRLHPALFTLHRQMQVKASAGSRSQDPANGSFWQIALVASALRFPLV